MFCANKKLSTTPLPNGIHTHTPCLPLPENTQNQDKAEQGIRNKFAQVLQKGSIHPDIPSTLNQALHLEGALVPISTLTLSANITVKTGKRQQTSICLEQRNQA